MVSRDDGLRRTCTICGGEITKKGSDICCFEEDSFLLTELKFLVRTNTDRKADLGEVIEYLYERLGPYLAEQEINLEEIDPDDVFVELEKRILRWIRRGEISVNSIGGLSVCEKCNAMIMRGRTLCNQCLREKELSRMPSAPIQSGSPPRRGGMHFKR